MEHRINQHVKGIQVSGIRQFANKVAQFPGAIGLTLGQPDFPTPEHIKEAAKRAIDENKTTYTPNAGLLPLRQAACDFVKQKYGQEYAPDEVITTIGASEGIDVALRALMQPGDEVIMPGPVYPAYESLVLMNGGVPVFVDTRGTGFKMTAEGLAEKISPKTRLVILPYPSNPTGCVMDREELAKIADVLRDKDIFVISDEIYSELVFDGVHHSIVHFAGMREKTVVLNGLSKSHSMTGWRIGFTFAPEAITKELLKVHAYGVACATSISQYAAIEALTVGSDDALPMREEYRKRRDYVYDRLLAMGIECEKPSGAFYLFPSIEKFGMPSFAFATKLLEAEHVAIVPGSAFSTYGEGYLRLSYAYSMEQLQEALDRLERFVKGL